MSTTAPGATRRHYLMCEPRFYTVSYEINPWMDKTRYTDVDLAIQQWRTLRDTYLDLGHRVDTIEPVDGLPDMVYAANGATVGSPVTIRFGLRGMGVAPAGVTNPNTGHHHLLVDVDTLPPDNLPLPNDANHRHFGLGQTETELTLPPGQHTLQLVLGDALHIPHQPPVRSEKITITVQ